MGFGICFSDHSLILKKIEKVAKSSKSTKVDKWSAGCQVIAANNDWHEFLDICHAAREIWGNNFTYTLIESNDIVWYL